MFLLKEGLGKAKLKPKFKDILSKSRAINVLSAARLFLFGARDVWFVVALPVYLAAQFGWDHWMVGGFLASWVIGYGIVQSLAPAITSRRRAGNAPSGPAAFAWAVLWHYYRRAMRSAWQASTPGCWRTAFIRVLFAVNSSLHSYLVVTYANEDGVSLDVGLYYMSNAMGRLIGTIRSGWVFQAHGLTACLWVSSAFIVLVVLISWALPRHHSQCQKLE